MHWLAADLSFRQRDKVCCGSSARQCIIEHGGTITHQHGVGIDHRSYLPQEKGPLGMRMLHAVVDELDPSGIMNRDKLFKVE